MPVSEPDVPAESPQSLLALARERMRTRHLSLRTEQVYLRWMRRFGEIFAFDGNDVAHVDIGKLQGRKERDLVVPLRSCSRIDTEERPHAPLTAWRASSSMI